jgi:peptidoglycan glycosyltransferase
MAVIAAGIARDGALPRPYLLADVAGASATNLEPRGTWKTPVSTGTAHTVRRALVTSVEEGWARTATAGLDLTAGGKTGTAEVPSGAPHAWFIGFAPADAPVLAIAVLVVNGGEGSRVAAPLAGRVLEHALRTAGGQAEAP